MRDANWMSIEKVAPTEVDWKAMDIDELVDRLTPGEIQKLLEEFDPDGNLLLTQNSPTVSNGRLQNKIHSRDTRTVRYITPDPPRGKVGKLHCE